MIKPITITELKKELKKMEQSELIELISNLYKSNDKVKEIINAKVVGEKYQEELLEVYKEKMYAEFFPENMRKVPSFVTAKNMIAEFKKVGNNEMLLDLMLHFVECGNAFTIEFGDIDGPFYNRLCSVYEQFIDLLNSKGTEDLYLKFKDRIDNLISSSSGIGWGYGDFIYDISFEIDWIQEEI
ncbi:MULTISPECIES: DUF6155 family protein [unclassified Fusibacter]|uniref:DUF6155 family protein n=1 Tax=unclassified Fusibacter TaxID=2624464 RepID=UPI0010116C87|nr:MULTISPECIES: DUF6155 family protein [unclassified Fusibacter]MCK8058433.1 DUF6155 family protein [Fusibacter sp. A2]NPE22799.1 hypothetical protein [Fusibacter sp. A1]RXV60354.1 hypothetical protein DWB64_13205 [Fusibacter sp. A1]